MIKPKEEKKEKSPTLTSKSLSRKENNATNTPNTNSRETKEKTKGTGKGGKKKTTITENTRQKYDWEAMKVDFFKSGFLEVCPFIRQRYGIEAVKSGQVLKMTTGWGEEKKTMQAEAKRQAMADFKSTLGDRWRETLTGLEQAHLRGLQDLIGMIMQQGDIQREIVKRTRRDSDTGEIIEIDDIEDHVLRPFLNHGDMINILKHIKLEKGEPTEIHESGNTSKTRQWMEEMRNAKTAK